MVKILFIYERDMPTISITRDIYMELDKKGTFRVNFCQLTTVSKKDIDESEVIVFLRPMDKLSPIIAKKSKCAGHLVITLLDDDLINVVPGIPWRIKGLKQMLQHSDVLLSSSHYICQKYSSLIGGGRTTVMDTIVRKEQIHGSSFYQKEDNLNKKIKVVYAAGSSHYVFFEQYVCPIMKRLIQRYGSRLSFTFIGVRPNVTLYESDIEINYVSDMELSKYRQYMISGKFDIGLAPLPENEFTKCKYFNKYIEYSMVGIVGIYSDVIPYAEKVKHGENGFLAKNTEEGWYQTFCEAIDNENLRHTCILRAQEDLRNNHSEESILKHLLRDVPELWSSHPPLKECDSFNFAKFIYFLYYPLDLIYLGIYYLKRGGVRGFLKQAALHVRNRRETYFRKRDLR